MNNSLKALKYLEEMAIDGSHEDQLSDAHARELIEDLQARADALRPVTPGLWYNRLAKLCSVLGVVLMTAAVMWFFASNWQALDRFAKLSLIITAFVGVNVAGGALYFRSVAYKFAGHLCILVGVVFFGLALALIGQIYNSNADAYTLFLVWLAPTLGMYAIFRFPSLPIMAVILINLTYSTFAAGPIGLKLIDFSVQIGAVILNLGLTALLFWPRISDDTGRWPYVLTWFATLAGLEVLTFYEISKGLCVFWNIGFILLVAASFYVFIEVRREPIFIGISLLAACFHGIAKYIEIVAYNFEVEVFIIGIFFGLGLVFVEWLFVRFITNWMERKAGSGADTKSSQEMKGGESK